MKLIIVLCIVLPALAGCQGMFGTVEGEHWRYTVGTSDPKLDEDTAHKIANLLADRLGFVVLSVEAETIDLSNSAGPGPIRITILVDRGWPAVDLEVRDLGKNPDADKVTREVAEKVRALLREMFPRAKEDPYIRYRGPFGP